MVCEVFPIRKNLIRNIVAVPFQLTPKVESFDNSVYNFFVIFFNTSDTCAFAAEQLFPPSPIDHNH